MSIHAGHPFLPPEGQRDPLRRLRGRLPAAVSVWTTESDGQQAGWTLTSFLLADGEPPELLGLLDEESDLADLLAASGTVAVSLLGWQHRFLADAFAGLAPAPGGPFRLAAWTTTPWGPVLDGAVGWVGARLSQPLDTHAGWGLLVRATIEQAALDDAEAAVLTSVRGRYRPEASPTAP